MKTNLEKGSVKLRVMFAAASGVFLTFCAATGLVSLASSLKQARIGTRKPNVA